MIIVTYYIYSKLKQLFLVYFTHFSENIYKVSNTTSNLALNGIAVGLQKTKRIFWYTNLFFGLLTWNYVYNRFCFTNNYMIIPLFLVCIYFYLVTLLQTLYLLKYIPESFFQN